MENNELILMLYVIIHLVFVFINIKMMLKINLITGIVIFGNIVAYSYFNIELEILFTTAGIFYGMLSMVWGQYIMKVLFEELHPGHSYSETVDPTYNECIH